MSDIDLSRVHLIGIGGAGMSGVARILLSRGKVVSGSDVKESRPVLALQSMGAHVAVGHKAENLTLSGQLPTVVVTSFAAIPQDNPELVAAREHNIPVIRRSDLLGELMTGSTQVLIAGTHGKTSTTSMTVVAMQAAGMDPSFAIGGQLNKAGTNAHQGSGHCFVAEADESDASLLRYSPDIAVVTNIEPDHLDFFHTPEAYFQVFDDFAARLTDTGVLVVCLDDEHAAALGERQKTKVTVRGYGSAAAAERHPDIAYTVVESVAVADQISHAHMRVGEQEVEVAMQIPGTHMRPQVQTVVWWLRHSAEQGSEMRMNQHGHGATFIQNYRRKSGRSRSSMSSIPLSCCPDFRCAPRLVNNPLLLPRSSR